MAGGAPAPVFIPEAWASGALSADITTPIPGPSQQPAPRASWTDGFPPQTVGSTATDPPDVRDFNGGLHDISSNVVALQAGQYSQFSAAVSTQNGGYAVGAIVAAADGSGWWTNLVSANTNNPDTTAAATSGWAPVDQYGLTALTGLTNANVTLTAPQAGKEVITLAGTLTGNIQIIFPTWTMGWTIVNNTTGAFTVTCKTPSGTGVIIPQGVGTLIYGDGTNIDLVGSSLAANSGAVANTLALRDGSAGLWAAYFQTTCDERLKYDVAVIRGGALERLDFYGGRTFRRRDDATPRLHAGLIAQEFARARPESVRLGEDGFLSVDLMGAVAELVECLREERDARRALEARFNALQAVGAR